MDLPLYLFSTHGVGREETEKNGKAKGDVGSLCARRMAIGRTEMDYKSNYRIGFRCRRCCIGCVEWLSQVFTEGVKVYVRVHSIHSYLSFDTICVKIAINMRDVYICGIELKSFIQIHCCHFFLSL